ncbi:MAG: hypothetical protein OXN96_20895 [Bryobacterales bacterium]|nr:hypothetical protein [Bryobacterales bacterium]
MATALSVAPDRGQGARLHMLNGKPHVEQENVEQAAGKFRKSIEAGPSSGEAHVALGLTPKRLDEGIEELEAILRDDSDDAETARERTIVWDQ